MIWRERLRTCLQSLKCDNVSVACRKTVIDSTSITMRGVELARNKNGNEKHLL